MNKQVLVILEGKHPELVILNKIKELFDLGFSVEIIFGSNIYELYRSIHNDPITKVADIFAGINTYDLIEKSCSENFKKYNHDILQRYTAQDFAFIYLFFDFDPWSANLSLPLVTVKNMLELFDNPTEYGKLYINYPASEAFNHITDDFKDLHYQYIKGGRHYKELAGKHIPEYKQYQDVRKLNSVLLLELIKLHLQKANFICNGFYVLPAGADNIEQISIFDKQFVFYDKEQKTYVLSSIPIFLFEVYGLQKLENIVINRMRPNIVITEKQI